MGNQKKCKHPLRIARLDKNASWDMTLTFMCGDKRFNSAIVLDILKMHMDIIVYVFPEQSILPKIHRYAQRLGKR